MAVRREYHLGIRKQKAKHWKEFVDNPSNVWKVNSYTHLDLGSEGVPSLQVHDENVDTDQGKAEALIKTFYPPQPEPQADQEENRGEQQPAILYWKITEQEVCRAIFASSPKKAPGLDDTSFLIWQKIWDSVKDRVIQMYRASIRLGHLPDSWRVARIITLRKPGKPDYTVPKTFRPISLLPTINKVLEAAVANRLSFLAEKHSLLPINHFGARKGRSCEQAIDILVERIYEAWRTRKVLSLVTFDVQGAFNGVNPVISKDRIREKRIPHALYNWIGDFCSNRSATIAIDTFESDILRIEQAGIPQGSPLSPILYIFYNANLVEQSIYKTQGALGFVDDYSAWVVGECVDDNTRKLQDTITPKAERWARESGAVFKASKTGLIHFAPSKTMTRRNTP